MKLFSGVLALVGMCCLCMVLGGGAIASVQAVPANDNFADATPLSGTDVTITGDTNLGATLEPGEPTAIDGSTAGASVWYVWTPTTSGRVAIDTATSTFDTLLAAYTGGAVG